MKIKTRCSHIVFTVIAMFILAGGVWVSFARQLCVSAAEVYAAETNETEQPPVKITFLDETCKDGYAYEFSGEESYAYFSVNSVFTTDKYATYIGKITSSNENIVSIDENNRETVFYQEQYYSTYISFKIKNIGNAKITISVGGYDFSVMIHVYPSADNSKITGIKQNTYKTAKITWKKTSGASGYLIFRALKPTEETEYMYVFKKVKTITKGATTSYSVEAAYNKSYIYKVIPYISYNNVKYYSDISKSSMYYSPEGSMEFTVVPWSSNLKSAVKSGSKSVKLTWNKTKGARAYKIFRSTSKNGTYKAVKTINDPSQTSVTLKVSRVTTYYYKMRTYFPDGSKQTSNVISFRLPGAATAKKIKISNNKIGIPDGQYSWSWASTENVSYYILNGALHIVEAGSNKITDYTLSSSLKVKKKKVIKLNFEYWGGFYKDDNNNFYVVVGYGNPSESKSKIVIKIIKYNKNWKKIKSAGIKGGVSNSFQGIYIPFDAGSCRMEMIGSKLYIHTCREMFEIDGVHHQSNISFQLDTNTMKVKTANDCYCSHSFNQFVKSDGGDLYLLDHGDAYPRSILLTIVNNYRKSNESHDSISLFDFEGETGDNDTGCTIGGMEIGKKHVVVCGTSYPNKYKVRTPKKGEKFDRDNVFVVIANKETGKKSLKWLTTYSNKNSNIEIGETRMVKIDDNHFAVLYNTTVNYSSVLHYVVINDAGTIVYKKNYNGYVMNGGTQPILYGNSIVWCETEGYDYVGTSRTVLYKIPAKY